MNASFNLVDLLQVSSGHFSLGYDIIIIIVITKVLITVTLTVTRTLHGHSA